jgi:hypothetical protein
MNRRGFFAVLFAAPIAAVAALKAKPRVRITTCGVPGTHREYVTLYSEQHLSDIGRAFDHGSGGCHDENILPLRSRVVAILGGRA